LRILQGRVIAVQPDDQFGTVRLVLGAQFALVRRQRVLVGQQEFAALPQPLPFVIVSQGALQGFRPRFQTQARFFEGCGNGFFCGAVGIRSGPGKVPCDQGDIYRVDGSPTRLTVQGIHTEGARAVVVASQTRLPLTCGKGLQQRTQGLTEVFGPGI